MNKVVIIDPNEKLSEEEQKRISDEIEEAKKYPITFDEDCEELSPAMMKAFRCSVVQRNKRNA